MSYFVRTYLHQSGSYKCLFSYVPDISMKLKTSTDNAIMNDCPDSRPLIPDRMFIALVQNTANIPMYT